MDLEFDEGCSLYPPDPPRPIESPRRYCSPPSPEPVRPDPIVVKYGDSDLVRHARDPDQIEQLIAEGQPVTANAIFAAIDAYSSKTLQKLLDTGASPNLRLEGSVRPLPGSDDQMSGSDSFTRFDADDHKQYYPIQCAANLGYCTVGDRQCQRDTMISLLLDHGADLYALTVQKLRVPWRAQFPGEADPDETTTEDAEPIPIYSVRSVIHAICEDGGNIQQFLDHPKVNQDLEHRDPHGRTLLHSVCRSRLGADAAYDASRADLNWNTATGAFLRDPFKPSEILPSRFRALVMRGANVLTTDYQGKNVLHHLFEGQNLNRRVPSIHATLDFVLTSWADLLINQPDQYGSYPLHTALQRWRKNPAYQTSVDREGLIADIEKLLAAGADPLERDGRGNTPLHYLADNGLAQVREAKKPRQLFQMFLNLGVDVNIRNTSGRCALDMVLDDNGSCEKYSFWDFLCREDGSSEAIDEEVFGMFDTAGVRWTEQDRHGRTLLHFVAKHSTDKTVSRAEYLLKKGVDPILKNNEGKTAREVAKENNNVKLLSLFKRLGLGRKSRQMV